MVKKYGDLYLECRRALMQTEDAQTAGLMARNLVAYYSGKSQEEVLRDRDLYAGEKTCADVEQATQRLLEGDQFQLRSGSIRNMHHRSSWLGNQQPLDGS